MPIVENPAALSCGCNHQQNFPSMGSGEGFEWDPSGVTFGIDFTTDRIFDGETISSDYSTIFDGAKFDEDDVDGRGCAVFDHSSTRPHAIGPLLTKLATLDYTCVIFWTATEPQGFAYLLEGDVAFQTPALDVSYTPNDTWATDVNGDYNDVGTVRPFSDNVIAFSLNEDGVLASLNGDTAVLSTPPVDFVMTDATFGCGTSDSEHIEGWIKAIIFYPATNETGVEAYSANAAPENTVAPVISGTAQEGQQLSITTGTWTGSPTSYTYQWYNGDYNMDNLIEGATNSTYTCDASNVGETMKCVVRALNADGIGGVAVSDDETVIAA